MSTCHIRRSVALILALGIVQGALRAFDAASIISPAPGTWQNKQMLVLNTGSDTDVYYSVSGTDPYGSGFSYDGPVLLDVEGDIQLKITAVSDGVRQDFTVPYTVENNSAPSYSRETRAFLNSIRQNPLLQYVSGSELSIPEEFSYSLGNRSKGGAQAARGTLRLSRQNTAERYVPCAIDDPETSLSFRFLIHVTPASPAVLTPQGAVPFTITDWTTLSFTDKSYIYKIDDSMWRPADGRAAIDRREEHKVFWQSVDYSPENPVYEYVLPPEPSLIAHRNADKSVTVTLSGDSRFTFDTGVAKVRVEAFENEEINEDLPFAIYLDGRFQGRAGVNIFIDKLAPEKPEIITSGAIRSRDNSFFSISAEAGANVFYAISDPYEIPNGEVAYLERQFESIDTGEYHPYTQGERVPLKQDHQRAVFYKINAYAVDRAGNKSPVSSAHIIVDETNYYISDAANNSEEQDGSYEKPFSSFAQFAEVLGKSDKTLTLHIYGKVGFPDGQETITKPCNFTGHNGGTLVFPDNSSIKISGASVSFTSLIMEKHSDAGSDIPVLQAEDATVAISECEISGVYASDTALISTQNSEVTLSDSGFTIQAGAYGCAVSAAASHLTSTGCRFTSFASLCAGARVEGGKCAFTGNSFKMIGNVARALSASNAQASLTNNEFKGDLGRASRQSYAIWSDTALLENSGNTQSGF